MSGSRDVEPGGKGVGGGIYKRGEGAALICTAANPGPGSPAQTSAERHHMTPTYEKYEMPNRILLYADCGSE